MSHHRSIKNRAFSLAALIALGALIVFIAPLSHQAGAQSQPEFGSISISGLYAAYTTAENRASANVAFAGHYSFDGFGEFTAAGMQNLPLENEGLRHTSEHAFEGTYTLTDSGLGTLEHEGLTWDLVVTESPRNSITKRAEAFHAVSRTAINGRLNTMEFRRLHDNTDFTNAMLRGLYSITFSIGDHAEGGTGVIYFDEFGNVSGSCLIAYANQYDAMPHDTYIIRNELEGSYESHNNGWGTLHLTLTSEDGAVKNLTHDFMITDVEIFGPFTVPSDLITLQRELGNEEGELVSMELVRIED